MALKAPENITVEADGTLVLPLPPQEAVQLAAEVRQGLVSAVEIGDLRIEAPKASGTNSVHGKTRDGQAVALVGAD